MLWIKQAVIKTVGKDDKKYPSQVVSYKGKTSDCLAFTPYGLYNNSPEGSGGLVFAPSGIESNLWGIFQDFETRFKDLKAGEVIVGSPVYVNNIEFKADGAVNILTEAGALNLAADSTLTLTNDTGDTVFNPDGSVAFANGATIDATGDYISATGISLNFHTHIGNLGNPTGPSLP
tara:strand:- start:4605 stop:5132 length:528 start_codon:yes stop_codon:yes gene_type:complete